VLLSVSQTGLNSVSWSTGETGFSIYGKEAGTITATALNTAGCESTSQIDLTTIAGPNVTATSDADVLNLGESAQLTASGADSYRWSPPETLDNPTSATPIATPTETTVYMVSGIGTNGCSGTAEVTVEVRDTGDKLPVEAPRMFSPNNDGVNDTWVIGNIQNFPDCELIVFTRSGKLVFETRGYNNDWDGRDINQNDLPEGAYFYTISCSDGKNASGSVSIIR
jgi:gliding motility-associated-like protein